MRRVAVRSRVRGDAKTIEELDRDKQAMTGESQAIDAEKRAMSTKSPAKRNAMVPAHDRRVDRSNAAVRAWNTRDDAYKRRQDADNAKVPGYTRSTGTRARTAPTC